MESIITEGRSMPYKVAVGRTIIECERPEEAVALAALMGEGKPEIRRNDPPPASS